MTFSRPPTAFPADTRRWINVGLTLVHRLRRWTNVKPTLFQRLVFTGLLPDMWAADPKNTRVFLPSDPAWSGRSQQDVFNRSWSTWNFQIQGDGSSSGLLLNWWLANNLIMSTCHNAIDQKQALWWDGPCPAPTEHLAEVVQDKLPSLNRWRFSDKSAMMGLFKPCRLKGFFSIWNYHTVLVSFFRFIWIPMLWV